MAIIIHKQYFDFKATMSYAIKSSFSNLSIIPILFKIIYWKETEAHKNNERCA